MIEALLRKAQAKLTYGNCDVHGEFSTYKIPGHEIRCPECVLAAVREHDRREIKRKRANSGIQVYWNAGKKQHEPPPLFKDATFDSFVAATEEQIWTKAEIETYANTFRVGGDSLFLCGKTGTGKTHLAISAMKRVCSIGYRTSYMTIFDLLSQARVYRREIDDVPITTELNTYDLLVIDEIGAHGDFGFNPELVVSTMFQIIDSRTMNKLPTVIITNLNGEELATSANGLGTRVVDRLSSAIIVPFEWESARKNGIPSALLQSKGGVA